MSKLRVAAYCRVSSDSDEQENSLELQKEYYKRFILSHEDWELIEIYCEKASGTNIRDRAEFNRMMRDCRSGLIDLILTKSVSRFGRNTVDTLTASMELFHLGVKIEI